MKIKRLSAGERRAMVNDAGRYGVTFSAKKYKVNRKTVYYWVARSMEGEGYKKTASSVISVEEKQRMIALALKNPISTIKEFMKENSITFSHPTVYNILSTVDVTLKVPKIIKLSCAKCSSDYDAIHLYVGLTRSLACPECGSGLKKERSYKIYILGSLNSLYLANRGELRKLSQTDVTKLRESLKLHQKDNPVYSGLSDAKGSIVTHMVWTTSRSCVIYLCGEFSAVNEQIDHSADSGQLDFDLLCPKCVERANELLAKGAGLLPNISPTKKMRNQKVISALNLSRIINNVSLICKTIGISRSTFYKHKKMTGII